jgi:hypothetical protein
MEGFTKLPKMQCFKEGGSVQKQIANYEKRERKTEEKADMAQDKAVVKKAIRMHDVQEHKGEKTDLSKLRKGGRAKKDCGTVKKYKAGGSVNNVYEAKKSSGDLDNIQKTKDIKPGKAAAPSKATLRPTFAGSDVAKEKSKPSGDAVSLIKSKESGKKAAAPSGAKGPDAFCVGGKAMKKYQAGGSVVKDPQALTDSIAQEENAQDRELVMGPLRSLKNMAVRGYNKLTGQGAVTDAERKAMAPSAPVNQGSGTFNKRNGGKIQKCSTGGSLKEVDANENPGLAKLPTDVRNKMGYMRKGGKAC